MKYRVIEGFTVFSRTENEFGVTFWSTTSAKRGDIIEDKESDKDGKVFGFIEQGVKKEIFLSNEEILSYLVVYISPSEIWKELNEA